MSIAAALRDKRAFALVFIALLLLFLPGKHNKAIRKADGLLRIHIMELPAEFNVELANCISKDVELIFAQDGFGPRLMDDYSFASPYEYRRTSQFALERMLHLRLLQQTALPFRFSSIDDADLIYVPFYGAVAHICALYKENSVDPPTLWNRLIDLLLNQSTNGKYALALGMIWRDYRLLYQHPRFPEIKDRLVFVGIERDDYDGVFIQVPYPAMFHLDQERFTSGQQALEWLFNPRRDGKYLVTMAGRAGNAQLRGPRNGSNLRRALRNNLQDYMLGNRILNGNNSAVWNRPQPINLILAGHNFTLESVYEAMRNSLFCLEPPGDSPSRKGFYDAILLGCIPVVFRQETYNVYTREIWNWRDIAIYIPEDKVISGELDVVMELVRVSEDEISSKLYHMQNIAKKAQYSTDVTANDDAFACVIESLQSIKT